MPGCVSDDQGMKGVRIARIGGVDVVADGSLVFLAALLTWAMYLDLDRAFPMRGVRGWRCSASSVASASSPVCSRTN